MDIKLFFYEFHHLLLWHSRARLGLMGSTVTGLARGAGEFAHWDRYVFQNASINDKLNIDNF